MLCDQSCSVFFGAVVAAALNGRCCALCTVPVSRG